MTPETIAPCRCGRRRYHDRHGVLHELCGTCRQQQREAPTRLRPCPTCGNPMRAGARGPEPQACIHCKRRKKRARDQTRRAS